MTKWKEWFLESNLSQTDYGSSKASWFAGRKAMAEDAASSLRKIKELDSSSYKKILQILSDIALEQTEVFSPLQDTDLKSELDMCTRYYEKSFVKEENDPTT